MINGKAYKTWRNYVEGKINVSDDELKDNIKENIKLPLPQLQKYDPQPNTRMMLLGGGPSVSEYAEEIKERRKRGWKLTTLNGAHNWCLENDIKPSIHIQLDAREWNKRFVENPVKECKYIISSQSHPAVFEKLKYNDILIWHAGQGIRKKILDKYYMKRWIPNMGGSTVATHSISILYMLGIRMIAIYGVDSCLSKKQHHLYSQPENDQDLIFKVKVGRKTFYSHGWMVQQADDFLRMLPVLPEDLKLDFRGDNMVTYIIHETAKRGNPPNISIVEKMRI